jgi:hypothetical protein
LACCCGTDSQNLETPTLSAANVLTLNIENGDPTTIDLSPLAESGGNQNLNQVLTQGNDGNGAQIKNIADPTIAQDAATKSYVDATVASGGGITDGSILIGGTGDTAQQLVLNGDATITNTAQLTISTDVIESENILNATILAEDLNRMNATDGQVLVWKADDLLIDPLVGSWIPSPAGSGSAVTSDDVTIEGTGADALTALKVKDGGISSTHIADDTILAEDLNRMNATDGQVLVWKADDLLIDPLVGSWIPSTNTSPTGTTNHIFFADTDGAPITSALGGLIWDPVGRKDAFEALYIGLDGNTAVRSPSAKVQIVEGLNNELAYSLQLQNLGNDANTQTAVGILFSTEGLGNFGKGGLVYQRNATFGRGDFHFLQDIEADGNNPNTTEDKAFTIYNNGDIKLYAGLEASNGLGGDSQVLSSATIAGQKVVTWVNAGGSGTNLQTADLVQPVANPVRTYEVTSATQSLMFTGLGRVGVGNFNVGTAPVAPENKFHVLGAIRSEGILNSNGTVNEPSYRFSGDTDTGMYWSAADELGFSVGEQTALILKETVANGLETISNGSLELKEQLLDVNGQPGTAGQVLSSTATGTDWVTPTSPIKGKGRIISGTPVNQTTGIGRTNIGMGIDRITMTGIVPNANYIVQLTVVGDFTISLSSDPLQAQTTGGFTVEIRDRATGTLTDADYHFTIIE